MGVYFGDRRSKALLWVIFRLEHPYADFDLNGPQCIARASSLWGLQVRIPACRQFWPENYSVPIFGYSKAISWSCKKTTSFGSYPSWGTSQERLRELQFVKSLHFRRLKSLVWEVQMSLIARPISIFLNWLYESKQYLINQPNKSTYIFLFFPY